MRVLAMNTMKHLETNGKIHDYICTNIDVLITRCRYMSNSEEGCVTSGFPLALSRLGETEILQINEPLC